MKTRTLVASVVVFLALTVLFIPAAQAQNNTICDNAIYLTPNGDGVTQTFTGVDQQRWYYTSVRAGRTYVVEAANLDSTDINSGVLITTSAVVTGSCAGANPAGEVLNRTTVEPASFANGAGSGRYSFIPSTNTTFFFPFTGDTNGTFLVRVVETTLFSPAWSTFGTFETFYSCMNATNDASLDGTLKLFNTAGAEVASFNFTNVPSNGVVSVNTGATSLNVANNQNGAATFSHNGAIGSFICEAAIANFTGETVIQPVQFKRRTND